MGNSRQDYGDCGAASLGNSCYKTQRAGSAQPSPSGGRGIKRTSRTFDGHKEHATYIYVREWERRRIKRKKVL